MAPRQLQKLLPPTLLLPATAIPPVMLHVPCCPSGPTAVMLRVPCCPSDSEPVHNGDHTHDRDAACAVLPGLPPPWAMESVGAPAVATASGRRPGSGGCTPSLRRAYEQYRPWTSAPPGTDANAVRRKILGAEAAEVSAQRLVSRCPPAPLDIRDQDEEKHGLCLFFFSG